MRVMPEQRTMVEVRSVQLFPLVTLAGLVVIRKPDNCRYDSRSEFRGQVVQEVV